MDPITIALMGVNFLNQQDQQRRQRVLDEAEAKWSGFKNYKPFESKAGVKNPIGDLTQALGWQRALSQARAKDGAAPVEQDETQAAKAFAPTASAADISGNKNISDEQNLYFQLLKAGQMMG